RTHPKLQISGIPFSLKSLASLWVSCRGFSIIDLVENSTTKTKYALKRMTCHGIEDQQIALREIELSSSINHRNIINIVDYMVEGNADIVINATSEVYMVLPYYKNGSLQDNLNHRARSRDFMNETQALHIFLGVCEGLKALHEAKPDPIAHRDLKTANICLSDTMEPVLVDLGSATEARVQICGQQDAQKIARYCRGALLNCLSSSGTLQCSELLHD
uniref:non-specific serine/threonine protein kinase n=1 Tax=Phlebotomus papatasi TaxID=29031 RepID=A0A1B0D4F1_PHLPP